MLLVTRRCAPTPEVYASLELPFELRQKSRLRTSLPSGEEVGLFLPRAGVLRDGEFLQSEDGRVIAIKARPERVLDLICASPLELARLAYHLGNRHVHLQVGEGWLRIADDHVLRQLAAGLGAKVVAREAAFEPEAGAYADAHRHAAPPTHGGVIHEFGQPPRT